MGKRKDIRALTFLLLVFGALLTGCQDKMPIERRALVMNIGFDLGEKKALALIPDIHNPKQSESNTQPAPDKTAGPPTVAPRLEGETIDDCVEHSKTVLPRQLDFGLSGTIVIRERAAREGIFPFLSWSMFQASVRHNAYVFVSETDLQTLFSGKTITLEGTQGGNILVSQLNAETRSPAIARTFLWDAYRTYLDKTGCITVPYIRGEEGKIRYIGTAIFHHDKMVGALNVPETALMTTIREERVPFLYTFRFHAPGGSEGGRDPQMKGQMNARDDKVGDVTVRIQQVKSSYRVRREGPGQYAATIRVDMTGMLSDANPPQVRYTMEDFDAMGVQGSRSLVDDMDRMLKKTQQMRSDVLQIGRFVRPINIEEWRALDWHDVFPTVPVTFEVTLRVVGATR
ncbi:hypothetical protein GTO89_11675 [Heliobacterium gestii]|uniref:Ger(X)C family spore germination protein n=1 Tax=Heliomicrobium gestii TaxID=2699 RepID=A0A845LDS1_HELGE|nr:Ger(x)C family spore germination C-terminal domain-containing protein [Heliomicrobium gestii]MBM7867437.1 hypothetical protein [Heliomicrobium gestii]MZP43701.1 hypothetical protein [Heliomicrobium gestii]